MQPLPFHEVEVLSCVVAAAASFAWASAASAHIISIGFENAGPGSVSFWYGSYHQDGIGDGPDLEGALSLLGINGTIFPNVTVPFTLAATVKPGGLVDGVTNFYANNSNGIQGTNILGLPVISWEGVTFTGLVAGDYQFTATPGNSAHWSAWNQAVLQNTVTLSGQVVGGGIPEPATLALFGAGLAGLAGLRRRRKTKS